MSTKARGKLTLERVLGLSTCSNAGLSVNRVTGDIAYPAGCVVVMYNFQRDKQTRYYRVEKPVSSIAFSVDGALLAIAEKGQAPSITVWDVETGQLKAEFKRHKYGVIAMAFSADSRFLVSMGLVHDKMLYAWDLSTNAVVGGAVVEDKIYAVDFSADGRFFVTVGYRHVHFWPLDDDNMFRVTGKVVADPPLVELASTPATMSRLADATFVDVGCGASSKTVALTADGFLCCFGGTVMERLVSLQASRGFAMSVSADVVAVAGAAATIRLFDPSTLEYKQTLPFPPSHGRMNDRDQFTAAFLTPPHPDEYAAAVAVRVVDATHVVAVYADHTLVVIERSTGTVRRTFFFHHGAVTDLQLVGRVLGVDARGRPHLSKTSNAPDGTFVTCSDDKTIRFWHLDRHKKSPPHTTWVNPYCPELLHVVYAHGATPSTSPLPPAVIDMRNPKDTADTRDGLKCVAVSDRTVAVGSNDGAIHVVQLDWPAMPQRILDKAHASAVLTVAYSPSGELLASGGRDRLTHVHDAAHIRTKTLENHSGAVVAVQFTADGKRLISAGADHNLVFTQHRIFRYNSFPVQGGKLHAMAVVDNDYVLTCVNTWVDVHTLISNKHVQTHHVGEHHRVALSPGAALVALGGSSHDKCIYIVDFHSGEVLAKAAGHGDAVTGLQFTLDGRRLVEVPLPPTTASALLPTSSWSLAHERDLLKKKKKQQETANAVADMQAKLGLLGILKPKPPTPVTLGQHNTVDNEGAAHGALELAKSPVHASIVAGYAAELEPETKYNSPDGSVEPRGSRTSNSKNGAAHSPVDVSVQQNVAADANQQPFGHVVSEDKADAVQAKPPPGHHPRDDDANRTIASTTKAKSSVDQIVDVQRSLSHFVSGYRPPQQQPKAPTTTTGNGSTLVTSFDTSSTLGVDASLSQFTSGYNRSPKARPSVDVPVDMSLSQFVSGFHPTEHAPGEPAAVVQQISTTTTPREQDSVDGTPVDMSLSHFVSGFHPDQTRTAPTDQHSSAVLPIIMEQQSIIVDETSTPLDMSLSQFVSGYEHAATPPSPPPALVVLPPASTIQPSVIDWTSDNLSLSHFVLGYSSPQEESNSSQAQSKDLRPVLLQDHNATTGPHVSVDCTTPVDASLGQFVTGYYGRQVSAEHDDDVDLHHVLVAADVDNLCPRDSLEQQSIETASEPHSASSSFDDDDNGHAFSKDVSLSQYISGYRSSVELIPVDMSLSHFTCRYTSQVTQGAPRDPPILEDHNRSVESNSSVIKACVDSDDSSSPQHLEGLHHTSQMMAEESDASRDKDKLVTISVNEPAVAA
ncbi:hypothetical protein DYB30_005117 [Aphanomyces astaci]|uniref:Anaphase-promoting complex subunit 4 WD40 domain-containing protein n=2 Tax=Aphanomyces astaci TaxID=112090 RepID=A0A397D9U2_APHAT|nr:hypothetical protein DYB30_005117 [Aphanomyces astaci]